MNDNPDEIVTVTLSRREWQASFDALLRDLEGGRETDFVGMLKAAATLRAAGFPGEPPITVAEGGEPS